MLPRSTVWDCTNLEASEPGPQVGTEGMRERKSLVLMVISGHSRAQNGGLNDILALKF
jgi:hypothetical protein